MTQAKRKPARKPRGPTRKQLLARWQQTNRYFDRGYALAGVLGALVLRSWWGLLAAVGIAVVVECGRAAWALVR